MMCPAHVRNQDLPFAKAPVKIPLKYPLYACFGVIKEGPRRKLKSSLSAAG